MDFFGCYIGQLRHQRVIGDEKPAITKETVDEWTRRSGRRFRDVCLQTMETPAKTWAEVAKECQVNKIPPDEITWAQEVIAGYSEPALEEARRRMQKWGNRPPLINALICTNVMEVTRQRLKVLGGNMPEPTKGEGFPA